MHPCTHTSPLHVFLHVFWDIDFCFVCQRQAWYLEFSRAGRHKAFQSWYAPLVIPLRFLLLCSLMIPISLKVSLDMAKLFYSFLIGWDLKMYDADKDCPAVVSNTAISEDLGQIDVVLSDKTGTLTENIMLFKKCAVGSHLFGENGDVFLDPLWQTQLRVQDSNVLGFLRALALCSSVTPTAPSHSTVFVSSPASAASSSSSTHTPVPTYIGSSPDEEALVSASAMLGCVLTERDQFQSHLHWNTASSMEPETYDILHVLPFSSDRKRMSVIVRETSVATGASNASASTTGRVLMFMKGADEVILPRCLLGDRRHATSLSHREVLHDYASKGLRTLCVSCKVIPMDVYGDWADKVAAASLDIHKRDNRLQELWDCIERDLNLLGVTGIEDKLQANVPQTIQQLRDAGIAFWMLTGDKFETAIEIGKSCGLLPQTGNVLPITSVNKHDVHATLLHHLDQVLAARVVSHGRSGVEIATGTAGAVTNADPSVMSTAGLCSQAACVDRSAPMAQIMLSLHALLLAISRLCLCVCRGVCRLSGLRYLHSCCAASASTSAEATDGVVAPSSPSASSVRSLHLTMSSSTATAIATATATAPSTRAGLTSPSRFALYGRVQDTLTMSEVEHRPLLAASPEPVSSGKDGRAAVAAVFATSFQPMSGADDEGELCSAEVVSREGSRSFVVPTTASIAAAGMVSSPSAVPTSQLMAPLLATASGEASDFAVVIDGAALAVCLSEYPEQFAALCLQVGAVICCRVSPSQKAAVTAMVKAQGKTTLAIGGTSAGAPVCVCPCMYACMHACMYVCMYVCMHVCM
jgi:magnesium-transporting ATPase (P-type)